MMADAFGIVALFIAFLGAIALANRAPHLRHAIVAAILVRSLAALVNYYVLPLPDSGFDAKNFEATAWEIAQSIKQGNGVPDFGASFYYSFFMSLPYVIFGRSALMLQAASVFVGTLCVYLSGILAKEMWDGKGERVVAWVVALFPTAILYSALTMREVYFAALLLIASLYAVRWAKNSDGKNFLAASFFLSAGVFVHGGMLVALAALTSLLVAKAFVRLLRALLRSNVHVLSLFIVVSFALIGFTILWVDPHIPKIGTVSGIIEADTYMRILSNRVRGDAAYPEILVADNPIELFWVVPLRVLYLLFSPFIWDIRDAGQLVGLFDSTLYLILAFSIAANLSKIVSNPGAFIALILVVALVIAFAIGTGNFGTALRHRMKLVPMLVVLGGPILGHWRLYFRGRLP